MSDGSEGDTVISRTHRFGETRFAALAQVESYWQALRGDRLMPKRSEVDPRGIERALEYAFIAERIAPGMGRLRVAGSHLNGLIGMEVRGMPLGALFTLASRRSLCGALDEVFDGPAIARLDLLGERGIGRPPLEARLLLMPLMSDFNDVSRILGCLCSQGSIGRAPRRFDISATSITALTAPAPGIEAEAAPDVEVPRRASRDSEFSEAAATFRHAPRRKPAATRPTAVPYLSVVDTEEEV